MSGVMNWGKCMKEIKFRARCLECKTRTYIRTHHIIDKVLVKYLVEIGNYDKGDIQALRNQLTVKICTKCEDKFHNGNFYNRGKK